MLKKMMENGAVEVKVLASTGKEMVVKRATTNGILIAETGTQEVVGEGFFNLATKRWQKNEVVAYKVDGEWVQVKKERKMQRMSLEEAVAILKEETGTQVQKNVKREHEKDPRYFLLYGDQLIPVATGFEIVARAKRIREVKEVMGA